MKKTIVIIGMIGLLCAGVAYAAVQDQEEQMAQQPTTVLEMYGKAEEMNSQIEVTVQNQVLSLQENPVLVAAQAQGLQAYHVDDTFAELISDYYMTAEEQQYLAGLMNQGYEAKWLAEIFEFYITCCEEKEIIKDIYDIAIEKGYADRFWIEDAYNEATENIHGVLDEEEMSEYLYVNGIEIEDVKRANILSRRGVYTIQQLLTKRQQGLSWSALINEVYQSDFSADITPIEAAVEARKPSSQAMALSEVNNKKMIYYADKNEQAIEAAAQSNEAAVGQALEEYYEEQTLQHYLEQGISVFLLYNAHFVAQSEGISVNTVLYQYQRAGKYARLLERSVVLP